MSAGTRPPALRALRTRHHRLRIESAVGTPGSSVDRTFDLTLSGSENRCVPISAAIP